MTSRALALDRLRFTIAEMVEHGEIVPCLNEARGYLWISEDGADQRAAAFGCESCPAIEACREYVTKHPEPSGVWAGKTRRNAA